MKGNAARANSVGIQKCATQHPTGRRLSSRRNLLKQILAILGIGVIVILCVTVFSTSHVSSVKVPNRKRVVIHLAGPIASRAPSDTTVPAVNPLKPEDDPLWDVCEADRRIRASLFSNSALSADKRETVLGRVRGIRQCHALGDSFTKYVTDYLMRFYFNDPTCDAPRSGSTTSPPPSPPPPFDPPRMIYSCESNKRYHFCGGMGDRFRGIIGSFWIALLSQRRFELFHPTPVPIQKYLNPHLVNFIPRPYGMHNTDDTGASDSMEKSDSVGNRVWQAMESLPVNQDLMSRTMFGNFFIKLSMYDKEDNRFHVRGFNEGQDEETDPGQFESLLVHTMRVQSNARYMDEEIYKHRAMYQRRSNAMQLPNITIEDYYGCLHALLFQPEERLWSAARHTLVSTLKRLSANESMKLATPSIDVKNSEGVCTQSTESLPISAEFASIPEFTTTHSFNTWLQKSLECGWDKPPAPGSVFPFISMQVRMGGNWATGLRIPESWRTFPSVLPHIFHVATEVTTGSAWLNKSTVYFPPFHPIRKIVDRSREVHGNTMRNASNPLILFVSSDSERMIDETAKFFSSYDVFPPVTVVNVSGKEAFLHTDTLNLADQDSKHAAFSDSKKEYAYFLTLLNHYLLSLSSHSIVSQSAFGETAFWASRVTASAVITITRPMMAQEEHLSFLEDSIDSSSSIPSVKEIKMMSTRIVEPLEAQPTPFYT